jgi:hypothetical protein
MAILLLPVQTLVIAGQRIFDSLGRIRLLDPALTVLDAPDVCTPAGEL